MECTTLLTTRRLFLRSMAIDPAGNDTYTVTLNGTVDGGQSRIAFTDTGFTFVGGNTPWVGFLDKSAGDDDLVVTPELLVSGAYHPDDTVNANSVVAAWVGRRLVRERLYGLILSILLAVILRQIKATITAMPRMRIIRFRTTTMSTALR